MSATAGTTATGLTPMFPFGYGLSYTSFSFSNLAVGTLPQGGAATVTAKVTNTGTRAGADVAQLYVTDPARLGRAAATARRLRPGQPPAGRQPDGHLPAHPAQPAVLERLDQQLGDLDRQLRHLGRRLGREPPADRDADCRLGPARPAGHGHDPGPPGRPGRNGGIGAGQRQRLHLGPDLVLLGDRPAGRDLDLGVQRHDHRDTDDRGHQHRHRQGAGRHRSVRAPRRSPGRSSPPPTASPPRRWSATRACASTSRVTPTPTAPRSRSTPATAPTGRNGRSSRTTPSRPTASAWT